MESSNPFSKKTFAIYGLGLSGKSVLKFLKRLRVKNYFIWDDKKEIRDKDSLKNFSKSLFKADYIVMSP